jgi:TolA-binding protein
MQTRLQRILPCAVTALCIPLMTGCLVSRSQLRADGGYEADEPIVAQANIQRVEPKGGSALEEMKQEVVRLTGRLEDLERSGAQANNAEIAAQKETIRKLEERVNELENNHLLLTERLQRAEGQPSASKAAASGSTVNEFQKGKALYGVGDFPGAIEAFGQYIESGKTKFLEEATFLRAEANFELKEFRKASADYTAITEKFRDSKYRPAAFYKIGMVFLALNQNEEARDFFQSVIDKFPKSPEAKKARERLK